MNNNIIMATVQNTDKHVLICAPVKNCRMLLLALKIGI